MNIRYEKHDLYPEAILVRNFIGVVGVKEIIESWTFLIENNLVTESLKGVINNLNGCDLSMNMESFKTLITFMKEQDCLKRIKLAVICDNPKTIVFPLLGQTEENELNIRPFSSIEAAVHWIMNN